MNHLNSLICIIKMTRNALLHDERERIINDDVYNINNYPVYKGYLIYLNDT
jgi:hypothetical protein